MNGKGKKKKGKDERNPKSPGILKAESHEDGRSIGQRSIKWDEMNVLATLHPAGKDYGHMKVDEPPTPYERQTSNDGQGVDPVALARRLEALNMSDDEEEEAKHRRETFEKKRRMHYNEYLIAKRMMSELEDEDSDDEQPPTVTTSRGKESLTKKGKPKRKE